MNKKKRKICVLGLGYVGLPLALAFGEQYHTLGYDISTKRVKELKNKLDKNLEISQSEFNKSKLLSFSSSLDEIRNSNIFIVTVPTPIFSNKKLNLRYVIQATNNVAKYLKKGDLVVYESTVYPGFTEEVCIPILNKSNLIINLDYFVGYSPERINPGDKKHTLKKIPKIVSGSNKKALEITNKLYSSILVSNTFKSPTIKIAEAAKVIENAQRDVNIAFMNELTQIFNKANINMGEVLKAANTKWNFIDFKPGFVGGHCIGVDPYYLNYLAEKNNLKTKIILNGRNINNSMSSYVVKRVNQISKENCFTTKVKIVIMGYTFKENCSDFRNTMSKEIFLNLIKKYKNIDVFDPYVKSGDEKNKKIKIIDKLNILKYDLIILLVKHKSFKKINYKSYLKNNKKIYDFHNFLKIDTSYKF